MPAKPKRKKSLANLHIVKIQSNVNADKTPLLHARKNKASAMGNGKIDAETKELIRDLEALESQANPLETNPFNWNEDEYSVDLSQTNNDRRQGTPRKVILMQPGKRKKNEASEEVFFVDIELAGLDQITLEIKRGDQLKSKVRQFCYSQSKES